MSDNRSVEITIDATKILSIILITSNFYSYLGFAYHLGLFLVWMSTVVNIYSCLNIDDYLFSDLEDGLLMNIFNSIMFCVLFLSLYLTGSYLTALFYFGVEAIFLILRKYYEMKEDEKK